MPSGVVSWPPCSVLPEVNAPTGLPASTPVSHRLDGAVEKRHERRSHVAEPDRTADDHPGAFAQVIVRGESGAVFGRGWRSAGVRKGGHRAQSRAAAGDSIDAARDLACELGGCAMAAVIEDEDLRHRGLPSVECNHKLSRREF